MFNMKTDKLCGKRNRLNFPNMEIFTREGRHLRPLQRLLAVAGCGGRDYNELQRL
eukprot:COSAG05_NODE_135_length_16947_cov_294.166548_9_plen_55_part_00